MENNKPLLGEQDLYLFREGTHSRLYSEMGCQLGAAGATFRVWAPNASRVSVIGAWNDWDAGANPLAPRPDGSGIWEGAVASVTRGDAYKFRVVSAAGQDMDKADPFALFAEVPPSTASRAWTLDYDWGDAEWMARAPRATRSMRPISIYEVHLGSWRRDGEPDADVSGHRAAAWPTTSATTASRTSS